jgi:CBS domain containing-hemolysin-like protein
MIAKSLFRLLISASGALRRASDALSAAAVRFMAPAEGHHVPGEPPPATEEGTSRALDEFRHEVLAGVLEMGETVAREVMVPRTDMVCLEAGLSLEEVLAAVVDAEHSRVPVYEEKVDNIIGVLYTKDLLKVWHSGREGFDVRRIIRPAYFIPETKPIAILLREFQRKRVHMAIVVDEYGGVGGLVTLEDVLEEAVGEIQDEYDVTEEQVTRLGDDEYLLDARLGIERLGELLGLTVEKDEFESLGGLAITMLGHLPKPGEDFTLGGWRFTVDKATDRKVIGIRVTREKDGDLQLPG